VFESVPVITREFYNESPQEMRRAGTALQHVDEKAVRTSLPRR
jgi:hypothetical protein